MITTKDLTDNYNNIVHAVYTDEEMNTAKRIYEQIKAQSENNDKLSAEIDNDLST